VTSPEIQPLWKEVLGDAEPQRQGRQAVIVVTILILFGEAVKIFGALMSGKLRNFFVQVIVAWVVALLLYFVWIGQSWARWLLAPVYGIGGCWDFIWGIIAGDGLRIVLGVGELIVFCYLVVSPSVWVFARHQREHIRRWEVLAISGAFLLVFVSVASAALAFFNYERTLKADATEFAAMAFHRVFENRDAAYLAEHSSRERKNSSPESFINWIGAQLGDVRSVGPLGTSFQVKFVPYHFELRGKVRSRVVFESGPVWITIQISGREPDWEIDHVSWDY
jgi:hypothetical protein